jgi:glyoxylase-like metal-dependent hydrolase (beta-lactamase superfamily II)
MRYRLPLLAVYLVIASAVLPGQQPDLEGRARQAIDRVLADLGGRAAIERHRYWHTVAHGRENLSADLQGLRPGAPTWREHQESVAIDATALTAAWERKSWRNDGSVRWRRIVTAANGTSFFDWVTHQGGAGTVPVPEPRRRAMARRMPHLLLLEAASAAKHVWQPTRRAGNRALDAVSVTLADGSDLTLLFTQGSPRVLHAVEFQTVLPGAGEVPIAWEFRNWRRHADLGSVPGGLTISIDGVPFQEVAFTTFTSTPDRPSILGLPAARHDDPAGIVNLPPPLPATGEVKPGVHVLNVNGFVVMAIEFRDFVVAVEAPAVHPGFESIPARPGSTQVTSDALAAFAKIVAAKPIRFLVVTHHHSDHLGGAALFARTGATILTATGHRAAVAKAVAGDGAARIETVSRQRTITDGERTIEILNTGENPHTGENLVVWLPRERILFQGDLFYYSAGDVFPPSGRAAMNRFFAGWLRGRRIEPEAIYGVHSSGAAAPALLELALKPSGGG